MFWQFCSKSGVSSSQLRSFFLRAPFSTVSSFKSKGFLRKLFIWSVLCVCVCAVFFFTIHQPYTRRKKSSIHYHTPNMRKAGVWFFLDFQYSSLTKKVEMYHTPVRKKSSIHYCRTPNVGNVGVWVYGNKKNIFQKKLHSVWCSKKYFIMCSKKYFIMCSKKCFEKIYHTVTI